MDVSGSLLRAPDRTLSDACGLPLAAYRRDHVQDCVAKVMRRYEVADVPSLVSLIDAEPEARLRLRRAVAVSTTGLFRDPTQLRWLDSAVMPSLTAGAKHVRAWSVGCGGGDEAFTLAMMLEWNGMLGRCEVIGSDILEEALVSAEEGIAGGARIPAGLRGRARWDLRDVTSAGAPDGDFQLVLCRNLLTFLTPVAAEALARTLAGSLALSGVLLVAREERIEDPEALGLVPISASAYRRVR